MVNQKNILLQYAKDDRFPNPTFFVDDGYSGTTFDCPGFQKMLDEIESSNLASMYHKRPVQTWQKLCYARIVHQHHISKTWCSPYCHQ
ncbi:hypothetical protein [Holdemania massiliensis]|uniref:hypothetical protein n=1 Tax=Holdemania massiliensis TaxID=1468449 RepID=UPI003BA89B5D